MAKTSWKYLSASVSLCKACTGPHGDAAEGAREVAVPCPPCCWARRPFLFTVGTRLEESRKNLEDVLCNI